MDLLISEISTEYRITRLKTLIAKLNRHLPTKIKGYSTYTSSDIPALHKLVESYAKPTIKKTMSKKNVVQFTKQMSKKSSKRISSKVNKLGSKLFDTTAIYDFKHLTGTEYHTTPPHIKKAFNKKFMEGGYGKAYFSDYNGKSAVYKSVKLDQEFSMGMFMWECVATERAAKIGIGADVMEKGVIYNKNVPKAGILILGVVDELDHKLFTRDECIEISTMLNILHEGGILHRDIGFHNIMKSGSSLAIIDYGLSFVFDGPVPEELRIYDHLLMYKDRNEYKSYLKTIKSKEYIALLETLSRSPLKLETLALDHFPINMAKTIDFITMSYYLVRVPANSVISLDRKLAAKRTVLGLRNK